MLLATHLLLLQAPGQPGLDLWQFFLTAGLMAKSVLLILAIMSLVSWAIMLGKALQLRRVDRQSGRFREAFRKSTRFSEVSAAAAQFSASPLAGIFSAGHAEIDSQVRAQASASDSDASRRFRVRSLGAVERSLKRSMAVELRSLARGTSFLATTAAVSPFIGLFGTVWGIMVAFQGIGITGSTSLVAVAPGIAEALINTAAGLAAAIPALIGFNYFSSRIRVQRAELDDFILEFINLTERNFT